MKVHGGQGPKRNEESGVETEASVLHRSAVLDLQADERALPGLLVTTTEWAVSDPLRLERLRPDREAARLPMPILLFHGTDDHTVPSSSSAAFARAPPEPWPTTAIAGAGHVESWNVGPARFERRGRAFLARVLGWGRRCAAVRAARGGSLRRRWWFGLLAAAVTRVRARG